MTATAKVFLGLAALGYLAGMFLFIMAFNTKENKSPCVDGLVIEVVGISGIFHYTDSFQGIQGPPDKNRAAKVIIFGEDGKVHQYFLPWALGSRWNPEETYSWRCEPMPGFSL